MTQGFVILSNSQLVLTVITLNNCSRWVMTQFVLTRNIMFNTNNTNRCELHIQPDWHMVKMQILGVTGKQTLNILQTHEIQMFI